MCALVVGAAVRGSWWAHPHGREIFRVNCDLADHPDVLVTKLISAKITYLDRALWQPVIAIGRARESWQIEHLSRDARNLMGKVDREPIQTDRRVAKPASELETNLLVHSEQFHTEAGAHARRLESWDHWMRRTGFLAEHVTAASARRTLEDVVAALNRRFKGRGRLPWQGISH